MSDLTIVELAIQFYRDTVFEPDFEDRETQAICLHCDKSFCTTEIMQVASRPQDNGVEPVCPMCGIDSVILANSRAQYTQTAWQALRAYLFENSTEG
jgi:hypothetical protein